MYVGEQTCQLDPKLDPYLKIFKYYIQDTETELQIYLHLPTGRQTYKYWFSNKYMFDKSLPNIVCFVIFFTFFGRNKASSSIRQLQQFSRR